MQFPLPPGQAAWFALTVKPRHEKSVAAGLARLGFEAYLPLYPAKRRWSDRVKIVSLCLFPGYLFCRFGYDRCLQVLNQPGVSSVVGFGSSPVPVPEEQIAAIRRLLASGSSVLPWPFLKLGQRVRIRAGALAGIGGILAKEKDIWRVVVNVELLQRSVAVEIDRDLIEPA